MTLVCVHAVAGVRNLTHVIEIEPEVRQWLDSLSDHDDGRAEFYADLLADNAETLQA